jgi:hypothetical protein
MYKIKVSPIKVLDNDISKWSCEDVLTWFSTEPFGKDQELYSKFNKLVNQGELVGPWLIDLGRRCNFAFKLLLTIMPVGKAMEVRYASSQLLGKHSILIVLILKL